MSLIIDSAGSIWIGGGTLSPDLPVTDNAIRKTHHNTAYYDGYIIKLSPSTPNNTGMNEKSNNYLPNHIHLHQNYPNPFNPVTTICYALNARSYGTLFMRITRR